MTKRCPKCGKGEIQESEYCITFYGPSLTIPAKSSDEAIRKAKKLLDQEWKDLWKMHFDVDKTDAGSYTITFYGPSVTIPASDKITALQKAETEFKGIWKDIDDMSYVIDEVD